MEHQSLNMDLSGFSEAELITALPSSLQDMAQTTSLDLALKMAGEFGGSRLRIPDTATPTDQFTQRLGVNFANTLIKNYGGERLYVPKLHGVEKIIRNRKIIIGYTQGSTINELAGKFKLSYRGVQKILDRPA